MTDTGATERAEQFKKWMDKIFPYGWNLFDKGDVELRREAWQAGYDFAASETARLTEQRDYWESRAKTAELKVLTFHEAIVNLGAERDRLKTALQRIAESHWLTGPVQDIVDAALAPAAPQEKP